MTDKLSVLSDSEKAVVETIIMRLNTKHSLQYMKDAAHEMCERTYFRQKKKVESLKWGRLDF